MHEWKKKKYKNQELERNQKIKIDFQIVNVLKYLESKPNWNILVEKIKT